MRNTILFFAVLLMIISSMIIGTKLKPHAVYQEVKEDTTENIPSIGSIEVLNGCGREGAANRIADLLRMNKFDVKSINNAASWNYAGTMVISRKENMNLAYQVDKILKTDKVVLIRNGEKYYDVTVIVGPDFEEKLK